MGTNLPKLPYFVNEAGETLYGNYEIQKYLAK